MTKRQDAIDAVLERDEACFDCGGPIGELHHICGRSKFGKNTKALCWQEKNMIMLCAQHHRGNPGAHTYAARVRHLLKLQELYGYDYSDGPWSEYV